MQLNFKVERMIASTGFWYEVMLSPFDSWEHAIEYITKYHNYYPVNEQNYKITFIC
jgi:hypothetical protein